MQSGFNTKLQHALGATVWAEGCKSWYIAASGKNTNNWPSFTIEYRRRTRYFDAGNYDLHPVPLEKSSSQVTGALRRTS